MTIPHKQAVLDLCDEVDDTARRVGAVNTLCFEGGRALGSNTDVEGFVSSLQYSAGLNPSGIRALVLGAGGSARAVVTGLLEADAHRVHVAARSLSRAGRLACDLAARSPGRVRAMPLNPWALCELSADLIVNTTPVGLGAEPGSQARTAADAFWARLPFDAWSAAVAYDLVYEPESSAFLARARAAGCRTASGLDMLARQGALSFQRWTGTPAEAVLPAMLDALRG